MGYKSFIKTAKIGNNDYKVVDFQKLQEIEKININNIPFSARVILENLVRNLDTSYVKKDNIKSFIDFYCNKNYDSINLIPFFPARILMQDFTGVPAIVDLAAMRDAVAEAGFEPENINPSIKVDLVIDHSVQVDHCKSDKSYRLNVIKEYQRNTERYSLLKWAAGSFKNFRVVPPGSGICHQVNLEYLASVVCTKQGDFQSLFPDTVIGTDSHTTMINSLGVLGWGVGGIEAEAVMLGEPYYMKLPEIIGVQLTGNVPENITATDIVLAVTEKLRKENVVEKIVEFTGEGVKQLSLTDRATISNMSPEYGATAAFFPVDSNTISYLKQTHRKELGDLVENYTRQCYLFNENKYADNQKIAFSRIIKIDLSSVELSVAGPSKPNQRILLKDIKTKFQNYSEIQKDKIFNGQVLIAAITSCTNTSNPETMMGAGLVARNALKKGLKVPEYVKTSLSPGSKVVMAYLENSGLIEYLNQLGFNNTGFGCMTCIGNSGRIDSDIEDQLKTNDVNTVAVLSGNRNFEARIHQLIKSNYLMSPALVVIFALAGRINIDLESEPIGMNRDNLPVYFRDLWPDTVQIKEYVSKYVKPELFKNIYSEIFSGDELWNSLKCKNRSTFNWDDKSLYIKKPPFFKNQTDSTSGQQNHVKPIENANALLLLGDSITTDHISPAGEIPADTPAGKYLTENKVRPDDFNTYGSRRGNHEVMMRGTFANIRIKNLLVNKTGGFTIKFPEKTEKPVYDAAMEYSKELTDLIVLGGSEYGTGSSRDWAAKGTFLLGVKAVITSSFERIHRSNLIGMGVLPLVFLNGQNCSTLNLTGMEKYTIYGLSEMKPASILKVHALKADGNTIIFETRSRLDTEMELIYYQNRGILNYVLNKKKSLFETESML